MLRMFVPHTGTRNSLPAIAMNSALQSHKAQLLATAAAASLATAGLISAYTTYSRRKERLKLNEEVLKSISQNKSRNLQIPGEDSSDLSASGLSFASSSSDKYDENLIREQLARNYAFFGEEGMKKIRNSSVAIIGCGGVGSAAAVMCARR